MSLKLLLLVLFTLVNPAKPCSRICVKGGEVSYPLRKAGIRSYNLIDDGEGSYLVTKSFLLTTPHLFQDCLPQICFEFQYHVYGNATMDLLTYFGKDGEQTVDLGDYCNSSYVWISNPCLYQDYTVFKCRRRKIEPFNFNSSSDFNIANMLLLTLTSGFVLCMQYNC